MMKKIILMAIAILILNLTYSNFANARGAAGLGMVKATTSSLDGLVYVYVDGVLTETPPACATFTSQVKRWVFNGSTAGGKIMLAQILTAAATKNKVKIWGSNTCDLMGNTEHLGYLKLTIKRFELI